MKKLLAILLILAMLVPMGAVANAEAADKGEFYGVDNSELEVAKEILERI